MSALSKYTSNGIADFPGSVLGLLQRRRKLVAIVFFSTVALVALVTFLLPSIYEATAKIMIERETQSEKALLFRLNLPAPYEKYDWLKTELEIINSYPVAESVVKSTGFERERWADPELSDAKSQVELKKAVEKFYRKLTVDIARNSNILEVSFQSKSPDLAAATVDSMVQTYQRYRSEIYNESDAYHFFSEQIALADKHLRELEAKQAAYRKRENIVSSETQLEIILAKLADYERSLTAVQTNRIGKEAKLAVIAEQFEASPENVSIPSTEVSDSPSREKYIAKLKGELLDMEIRRERLLQRFKPTYEEIVELEADINATKEKIKSEVRQIMQEETTAIKALRAEERILEKSISAINDSVRGFAQKEYEMSQLSRGIEDSREVYSMLLKQKEEARISLARLQNDVRIKVVSPAIAPTKPIKPRRLLNLFLAVLLGLMLGYGAAYMVEWYENTASEVRQLESRAEAPKLPVAEQA